MSKFFFDRYSTDYMFYDGAYQMPGGRPSGNNQVQGYDCISSFWGGSKLHPNGAIYESYSDDMGKHWTTGNGGHPLRNASNASATQDVSLQATSDTGFGAVPAGGNKRITSYTWDPQQPGQSVGGLTQAPCADGNCASGFIGDYFGLAVSRGNIYGFFVSTHDAWPVTADGGGPVYYQHVLATVSRSALGI